MFWQEDTKPLSVKVDDDVVDVVFSVRCQCLPVDHSYALSQAIQEAFPWLVDEAVAGVHSIHVAASSNGWIRPDDPQALLHLSRRTRLVIRVPKHRIEDICTLEGKELDVCGHSMQVQKGTVRPLSSLTTLFSRHLASEGNMVAEEDVLEWVDGELKKADIEAKKMMCGSAHDIATPDGPIRVRSLMIAELEFDESLRLQKIGIGPHRHLGCGLFIPHKGINDVRSSNE